MSDAEDTEHLLLHLIYTTTVIHALNVIHFLAVSPTACQNNWLYNFNKAEVQIFACVLCVVIVYSV